jgi:hypothetical protein
VVGLEGSVSFCEECSLGYAGGSYHCVQHRTRRSRVALFRSDVLGPFAHVARNTSRDNESGLALGQDEVQDCETKVPQHNKQVGQDFLELGSESHCKLTRRWTNSSRVVSSRGRWREGDDKLSAVE